MAIMKWDPFKEMMNLQDEVRRMFRKNFLRQEPMGDENEETWSPAVNMYEKDNKLFVEVELPGLEIDDLEISIEDDVLHIEGERRFSEDIKEENILRMETSFGRFERYLPLPHEVDTERMDATVCNGVLKISMLMLEQAKPKHIPVKVA
jgi:HSP20 family protein